MNARIVGYSLLLVLCIIGCRGSSCNLFHKGPPQNERKKNDAHTTLLIEYHENGKIHKTSTYKDNILHGPFKEFYPTGSLKCEKNYVDGLINGTVTFYDAQGPIISTVKYREGIPETCVYKEQGNNCFSFNDTSVCFQVPGYCFDNLYDIGIVFYPRKTIAARKDIAVSPREVLAPTVYHAKIQTLMHAELQNLLKQSKQLRTTLHESWPQDSIHYIGEQTFYVPADAITTGTQELEKAPARVTQVSRYTIDDSTSLIIAKGMLRLKDSYFATDAPNHSYTIKSFKIYIEKGNRIIFEIEDTHLVQDMLVIKNNNTWYLLTLFGGYETAGISSSIITDTKIQPIVEVNTFSVPIDF
jgi:hypothetical protein